MLKEPALSWPKTARQRCHDAADLIVAQIWFDHGGVEADAARRPGFHDGWQAVDSGACDGCRMG